MVITIPKVLNEHEVQQYQKHLRQAAWQSGQATAGSQAGQVKQNWQLDQHSELAQQLGDPILQVLSQTPEFVSSALPLKIYPPMFNRYQDGAHYGWHVDNAIRLLPNSPSRLRTDLSATLFLNHADEYEGGELVIQGHHGEQTVKLNAGDLVIYPSTSLHQVAPVTRGQRLASFFWIESMIMDHEMRSVLFDLDQSVQKLTQAQGTNSPDVLTLSGIYHRLLRLHATT